MATDVTLRCSCGAFRGLAKNVSPSASSRMICLCDDCQAYAHQLGRAKETLDENGGTDIFPLAPYQLKFTQGVEHLRCLRLSDKGMLRWYAGCCQSPIANTPTSSKVPYAGVVHSIMDHAADGQTREQAVGPVRGRVLGKYGIGPLPKGTHQGFPLGLLLSMTPFLAASWFKSRHQDSPFFDQHGRARVSPTVLSPSARESLRKFCGPNPSAKS